MRIRNISLFYHFGLSALILAAAYVVIASPARARSHLSLAPFPAARRMDQRLRP
jgi:hypothetical protein